MTTRKPNISRTGVRIIHIAYDLDDIAHRLRAAGEECTADSVAGVARGLHALGRDLDKRRGRI